MDFRSRRVAACGLFHAVLAAGGAATAYADSSTPRLASYYEQHLVICSGDAWAWRGDEEPTLVMRDVMAVGTGRRGRYALALDGRLHGWGEDARTPVVLMTGVRIFAAGSSGVLAIDTEARLWRVDASGGRPPEVTLIAPGVKAASVGDGTNYYVTIGGDLHAQGNAHRGQYGDGRRTGTVDYVRVATGVIDIKSHTGHAIMLTQRGTVMGTGGNIFGPLGRHGLGDKAEHWGIIFDAATSIATGASHSLALRADGSLWTWGRNEGPEPRQVLPGVYGVAAGSDVSIALGHDGSLWQWRTGAPPKKKMDCPG